MARIDGAGLTPGGDTTTAPAAVTAGMDADVTPSQSRSDGGFLFWSAVLFGSFVGMAQAVQLDLPPLGLVAFALFVVGVSMRLLTARAMARRALVLAASCIGVVAGTGLTIGSVLWEIGDDVGFGGFGLALFCVTTLIALARQAIAERDADVWPISFSAATVVLLIVAYALWGKGAVVVALAAFVAWATAIGLWSAVYPQWLSDHPIVTGVAGAGVLVAAWFLFLRGVLGFDALDPVTSMWIAVTLGIVSVLLITSNATPAVIAVLTLVVAWAGATRDTPDQPGRQPVAGEPYFAVLGDSYISGEGAHSYYDGDNDVGGSECRRAPTAWPQLLNPPDGFGEGATLGVPVRVAFLACSGAVTADIRRNVVDDREQPEQLDALEGVIDTAGAPLFVVVSVGGNDLQFSDVGTQCILPGDCSTFVDKVRASRLALVGDELERTYAEIRLTAGHDVPVIAVPYPRPARDGAVCRGVPLSENDIAEVNTFASDLNAEVAAAAAATGVHVMDTFPDALADSGAQLCEPHGPPGLNFARINPKAGDLWATINPRNWTHNFIHPNEDGHEILAAAALRYLHEHPAILDPDHVGDAISEEVRARATAPSTLPAKTKSDVWDPLGDAAPSVVLVAVVFIGGWWLLLTALAGWKRSGPGQADFASLPGRQIRRARHLLTSTTPSP